jgi:hypothetical protein
MIPYSELEVEHHHKPLLSRNIERNWGIPIPNRGWTEHPLMWEIDCQDWMLGGVYNM